MMSDYESLTSHGLTLDEMFVIRIAKGMIHDCLSHAAWHDFTTKVYYFVANKCKNNPLSFYATQGCLMLQKLLNNVHVSKAAGQQ